VRRNIITGRPLGTHQIIIALSSRHETHCLQREPVSQATWFNVDFDPYASSSMSTAKGTRTTVPTVDAMFGGAGAIRSGDATTLRSRDTVSLVTLKDGEVGSQIPSPLQAWILRLAGGLGRLHHDARRGHGVTAHGTVSIRMAATVLELRYGGKYQQ
jgi:hypothetical protein